ncbi:MAG: hypothetical protein LH660_00785, partial [Phormidesmis sp. CAN_BIN36]|nr:hypothetical protein [Phormidesmis sp. CAN_BIN36]
MSTTLKPLGLQKHLMMHRPIGQSNLPLGKRSPLGMSSDWIQTFPVLQSIEQSDRLSQTATVYSEFDFSAAQSTLEETQQQTSTEPESHFIQAKESSDLVVPAIETVPNNTLVEITEVLSSQINRLPLAPPVPLGNRPVLNLSERSTPNINPNTSDVETQSRDRSSISEPIEASVRTPLESVEHSISDSPLQSEEANFVEELPAPPIQFAQIDVEPDVLDSSALSEVEARKLSTMDDHPISDAADKAHPIQFNREPGLSTPDIAEAINPTILTHSLPELVELESTIGAKLNNEAASLEVNSLDTDVDCDRAPVLDQLVSPSPDDAIPSPLNPPQTDSESSLLSTVDGSFDNLLNRSIETNLKFELPTQVNTLLSKSTQTGTVEPVVTPNQQINIPHNQLISPSEIPSSLVDIVPPASLETSPRSSESVAEPVIQLLSKQSNADEKEIQTASPTINPGSNIEPVATIINKTPSVSPMTSELTLDRAESKQSNANAPTPNLASPLDLLQLATPVDRASNIQKSPIEHIEPIQFKSEDIQKDSNSEITKYNDSEITNLQIDEETFQTLPPLGMTQPLAPSRLITPPLLKPLQEPSSQAQSENQSPVPDLSSLTIAQSLTNSTQNISAIRESSNTDQTPDSGSGIADSLSQSSAKNSEEESNSQERSWQDVAASLTDIS